MFSNFLDKSKQILKNIISKIEKSGNPIETVVGFLIIIFAFTFFYWSYNISDISKFRGYKIYATFSNTGDLLPGADVKIKGIKVGSIIKTTLVPETYIVDVEMEIDDKYELPKGTIAKITSSGLMGAKYVSLILGNSSEKIYAGERLSGQNVKSIEEIIGSLVFSSTN